MDANEPLYVVCRNGAFTLPESIFRALSAQVTNGFVYFREDEDSLTISATRITGAFRRPFLARMRAPMFRNATQLGIVNLRESIRVMVTDGAGRAPSAPPPVAR
ncbi:MAG TPA: hypothetical protein VEK79_23980 [Thermoanaerobaculia bacterium]|nr:hypothetical protein [Thermoanaerobaculia bacterium]